MTLTQAYLCWTPDYDETEDDAKRVLAVSSAIAAEEYARRRDWNAVEYPPESVVMVRRADGSKPAKKFKVTLRMEAAYHAKEVR